jgi:PAS domain S-box-containing protein
MNTQQPYILPQWPYIFAKFTSSFAILLGTMVILGWTTYFWLPADVSTLIIAIKPNEAFCFILAGTALWLRCENHNVYTQHIAQISGACIFLVGFLTLFEYFFGINIGIDQGIFKEHTSTLVSLLPPGRMSPYTATNFVLIGFVLFFMNNNLISFHNHQSLMTIVFFFSLFTLLSYVYHLGNTFFFLSFSEDRQLPPLLCIIGFLFLSLGIFFARPQHGLVSLIITQNSSATLARRLILPAILLPMILGYIGLAGKWLGAYQTELGVSIIVTSTIFIFVTLILLNSYLMNKIDSERGTIENALHFQQRQLQTLLDNTTSIVYVVDLDNKYILVNKQFETLTHMSSSELMGKDIEAAFPKIVADKFKENNLRVINSRTPIVFEEAIINRQGVKTFISNKFPLFNDLGIPYAVGGISTEITEIKHMQETLREHEERLSLALKSVNAGTWSWNVTTGIMEWDEAMHLLFNLIPGAFPRTYDAFLHLVHPDDRHIVTTNIKNSITNGGELDCEFRTNSSDGPISYLGARAKVYQNEKNQNVRMTGTCWNISKYKEAENEIRIAKEIAEKLAHEAKEASYAKSAFLAAMSHEIRTPLNGVIGMTELMRETNVTTEQHDYIETIRLSGEALLGIINDILDFSKIESGHMELEILDYDMHSLVNEIIELFAIQIQNKGVAIGAYIESDVPEWLTGDPSKVRQVLSNLLSNSAKFTEKGEISLRVKLLKKEGQQLTLLFEIIDTGIGITPAARKHLFLPFSQGDSSTSRKFGGTGLGLVISQRLVEMMGGEINVDSIAGSGSKFWFTITLTESIAPKYKFEYELESELRGVRILCVDDNAINRDTIKHRTESWQLRCDVAMNAAEALSMLKKAVADNDPYKLALIDYAMPGMNGIELIQIMRQLSDIEKTPAIILSAPNENLSTEEVRKFGIPLCLAKPIRPNRLYDGIITILKKTHGTNNEIDNPASLSTHDKWKNARILLAEDHSINQQVIMRILEKIGLKAEVVTNGIEVLAAIKKNTYDLILMDCQMPEMDGYTAAEEIRKMEELQHAHYPIPIVAITAHALKNDREKCIMSGMNDYVAKPIKIKTLKSVLELWLLGRTSKTTLDQPTAATEVEHPTPVLLDMNRIHEIFDHDVPSIREFLHNFIDSTAVLLNEISNAVEAKNSKLAKELFHRLKGSAGNSGIMPLHLLCVKAEESISASDWDTVIKQYKEIVDTFKKLQNEINANF